MSMFVHPICMSWKAVGVFLSFDLCFIVEEAALADVSAQNENPFSLRFAWKRSDFSSQRFLTDSSRGAGGGNIICCCMM